MNTCETCRFSTGWKRGWLRGWRAAGERISEAEFARRMGEDREDAGCGEHTPRESEASGRALEPTDYNEGFEEGWKVGRDSTREPTEAMIEAGRAVMRSVWGDMWVPNGFHAHPRAVWDAMWKARD